MISDNSQCDPSDLFNWLYSNFIPYQKITPLLQWLIKNIIPVKILGEKNYQKILLQNMKDFVEMKRFENQKMEDYIVKMDVFSIPWLEEDKFSYKFRGIIIKKRRKLLAEVVCLIMKKLVIPFVRMNFYVTDKHQENRKIFYYRKPLWVLVIKLTMQRL